MRRRRNLRVTPWACPTWPWARVLARCAGITEVDVRSFRMFYDRDVYEVRAWNHRRYLVTGQEVHSHA